MKRYVSILLGILLILVFSVSADAVDSIRHYSASCFIGGTTGCLDGITGAGKGDGDLTDGDLATVNIATAGSE
jgi:hypothetical protein